MFLCGNLNSVGDNVARWEKKDKGEEKRRGKKEGRGRRWITRLRRARRKFPSLDVTSE